MSRKFVRNVTGTKLKGEKIEPFDTNVQNDLLSDETDVYVRQERSKKIDDQYHCLTDNVKEVISNSDLITTDNFEHGVSGQEDKNKSYINVNKSNKTESEKMESNSHVMTPLQTGYSIEKNNRDVIPGLVKQHETPTEIESKSERINIKKVRKNEFEVDFNDEDLATKDYVDDKIEDIDIEEIDIPNLVKQHETPTEIVSKSDELKVKKVSKNNFELELDIDNNNIDIDIVSKSDELKVKKVSKNNFELELDIDDNDTDIDVDDFNMQMFINSLNIDNVVFYQESKELEGSITYNEDFFEKVKHLLKVETNEDVEHYSPVFNLQTTTGGVITLRNFVTSSFSNLTRARSIKFSETIESVSLIDEINSLSTFMYMYINVNNVYYSMKKSNVLIDRVEVE